MNVIRMSYHASLKILAASTSNVPQDNLFHVVLLLEVRPISKPISAFSEPSHYSYFGGRDQSGLGSQDELQLVILQTFTFMWDLSYPSAFE